MYCEDCRAKNKSRYAGEQFIFFVNEKGLQFQEDGIRIESDADIFTGGVVVRGRRRKVNENGEKSTHAIGILTTRELIEDVHALKGREGVAQLANLSVADIVCAFDRDLAPKVLEGCTLPILEGENRAQRYLASILEDTK